MKHETKELTPFERLKDLTRRLVAVPKAEIEERAKAYKRRRKRLKTTTEHAR